MLRRDGKFEFFIIEHERREKGDWVRSNLGRFGHPPGFSANEQCWQQLGEHATFDPELAEGAVRWLSARWPEYSFRAVRVSISQKREPFFPEPRG